MIEDVLTKEVLKILGNLIPSMLEHNKIPLTSRVDIGEVFKMKNKMKNQSLIDSGYIAMIYVNDYPRMYAIIDRCNGVSFVGMSSMVLPLYENIIRLDETYDDLEEEDIEVILIVESTEYFLSVKPKNLFIKLEYKR